MIFVSETRQGFCVLWYSSCVRRQLMLWESEIQQAGDGRAVVVAKKPVATCGIERVLIILGMEDTPGSRWTIYNLVRCGVLKAWKPGAVQKRKDGKRSNAKLVFDMESVLLYKESIRERNA